MVGMGGGGGMEASKSFFCERLMREVLHGGLFVR